MIDGLSFHKRALSTPFDLYEVFYHNNFLDYVWKPKKWLGPNREKFVVADHPDYTAMEPKISNTNEGTVSQHWFHTLEDAAKHLLESAFCEKL